MYLPYEEEQQALLRQESPLMIASQKYDGPVICRYVLKT